MSYIVEALGHWNINKAHSWCNMLWWLSSDSRHQGELSLFVACEGRMCVILFIKSDDTAEGDTA